MMRSMRTCGGRRRVRRGSVVQGPSQKKLEQRRAMREANAEAFRKEIEEFTANFLNAAREAFALIDKDDSGSLSKTEIVARRARGPAGDRLPAQLRRGEPAVFAAAGAAREGARAAGHGQLGRSGHRRMSPERRTCHYV